MLSNISKFLSRCFWVFMSLSVTLAIIFGVAYTYLSLQLPDVNVLKDAHMQVPLRIYTADNQLIAQYGAIRRHPVTLDHIPPLLIKAVLATEDARYYEHAGVDLVSILRAAHAVLRSGRKVQGASTITMQVARNFFLTRKKTYGRKIKEILLALKIDKTLSKDKVLALYLNKVYFGKQAYGVAAAAQVYYGKTLSQLTLPEMAMIAGLPQSPSRNNPLNNPPKALKRRNHVLWRMKTVGFITPAAYAQAIQQPLTAGYHGRQIAVQAPYVAEMVRQVMVAQYGDSAYDAGYTVYTTLSSGLQQAATDSLHSGLVAYNNRHNANAAQSPTVQGALIAMDPQTGAIRALNGGFDYTLSHFNRATQAKRQPGSDFKPFIYAAALDKNFTLATLINDAPIVMADSGENSLWRPRNDTEKFYGPTRLKVGLAKSRNLVSIRILQAIGIDYALEYMKRFGFDPEALPHTLSLALGSATVTPLEIATAYAVFANGGYRVSPYFIQKIVNENGKTIYQANPPMACEACITLGHPANAAMNLAPMVLSPQTAYLMNDALQSVIQSGTGRAAKVLGRSDLAGKTGTTNDQVDAWFTGFNSQLLATVWVGYDDMKPLHEYGSQAALPIWIQFMKAALKGMPNSTMPEPSGIVSARINANTGLLATSNDPHAIFENFRQDHVPNNNPDTKHLAQQNTATNQHDDTDTEQPIF